MNWTMAIGFGCFMFSLEAPRMRYATSADYVLCCSLRKWLRNLVALVGGAPIGSDRIRLGRTNRPPEGGLYKSNRSTAHTNWCPRRLTSQPRNRAARAKL